MSFLHFWENSLRKIVEGQSVDEPENSILQHLGIDDRANVRLCVDMTTTHWKKSLRMYFLKLLIAGSTYIKESIFWHSRVEEQIGVGLDWGNSTIWSEVRKKERKNRAWFKPTTSHNHWATTNGLSL